MTKWSLERLEPGVILLLLKQMHSILAMYTEHTAGVYTMPSSQAYTHLVYGLVIDTSQERGIKAPNKGIIRG